MLFHKLCGNNKIHNRLFRYLREALKAFFKLFVGRDGIAHRPVKIRGVSGHIEIAGARQAEEDVLASPEALQFEGFLDRRINGMEDSGAGRIPSQREKRIAASNTLVCSTARASSRKPS